MIWMKNCEKIRKSINNYFDKDDNYKKISKDIEKQNCTNIMWKYSLIPICLVVIFGGLIFTNFGNNKKDLRYEESFIEGKNIIKSTISDSTSDRAYNEEFSTIVNHSDAVIKGKVKSLKYVSIKGRAWTKVTLHIDDVLLGDLKQKEDIEVYFAGGYIPLDDHIEYFDDSFRFKKMSESEIKNTVLKEIRDGETEFVKENEELVLCIAKTPEHSPLPKNSYERLFASGMLKLKGNKYVQLYGEVKERYSVDKDKLDDIKKLTKK